MSFAFPLPSSFFSPCISLFYILPTFFDCVYPVYLSSCHFQGPLCPTHIGCHLSILLRTVTPPSSNSQLLLAFPPSKGCNLYTHACNINERMPGTEIKITHSHVNRIFNALPSYPSSADNRPLPSYLCVLPNRGLLAYLSIVYRCPCLGLYLSTFPSHSVRPISTNRVDIYKTKECLNLKCITSRHKHAGLPCGCQL